MPTLLPLDEDFAPELSEGMARGGPSLTSCCVAEALGTFLLVLFGLGAVHAAVLFDAQSGLWQIAVVWAIAIAAACYTVGGISGAHINPAITVALAVWRGFPWRKAGPYIAAQLVGAFAAAAMLFVLFEPALAAKERAKGVVRGEPGSIVTALCYGEYFPAPGSLSAGDEPYSPVAHAKLGELVSHPAAFLAEAIGTLVLALVVFAVTDERNAGAPPRGMAAVFIGLTVAGLISFIAPLTQACFNPARDFGPRLFAALAGWGQVALPGPCGIGFFTVYILAPIVGAVAGGAVYTLGCDGAAARPRVSAISRRNRVLMMQKTPLLFVGGFLGAGKTTLLAEVAARLTRRGQRVGLVTNDQAANLVDTAMLRGAGLPVQEVAGGCFCCRFNDLVGALDHLTRAGLPDVLVGEPVGSCTDLSATVMQPFKQLLADRFRLCPLTVLVDPQRLQEALGARPALLPDNVAYIYRKQLEEADAIAVNKIDLLSDGELVALQRLIVEHVPGKRVFPLSAQRGDGIDAWLDYAFSATAVGATIAAVDYDTYADGEAALGWLNAALNLEAAGHTDWRALCLTLIAALGDELRQASAEVAHLKLHLSCGPQAVVANLTSNSGTPMVRGDLDPAVRAAKLVLNVRAKAAPEVLRAAVETGLAVPGAVQLKIEQLECFAPSRPQPTHRFAAVVA